MRVIVYTTNAIESLNMSLRKTIKTRGAFPTEDAALKVMYLALKTWPRNGKPSKAGKMPSTTSRCCGKTASRSSAANQQRNTNQIVYTKIWTLPRRR